MPFQWKKKTDRVRTPPTIIKEAIKKVLEHRCSIRDTAKKYNMDKMTLSRYIKKYKEKGEDAKLGANYNSNQMFTSEEESYLTEYLLTVAKMNYGITAKEVRKIGFLYAKAKEKKITQNWITNKSASSDWLRGFMLRNQQLSLRSPEPNNQGYDTTFDNLTVEEFYKLFNSVLSRKSYNPENIYNFDETGVHFLTSESLENPQSLTMLNPSTPEDLPLKNPLESISHEPDKQTEVSSASNSLKISTKTTPEKIRPFSKVPTRRKHTKPTKILPDTDN